MDYKEQASYLKRRSRKQFEDADEDAMYQAAQSIENLLSRTEAAEARCKALETRLETAEKMVREYQEELIPGYRERAEKAERERDAAAQCLFEKCIHIEINEGRYFCGIDDEPCDRCINVWSEEKGD